MPRCSYLPISEPFDCQPVRLLQFVEQLTLRLGEFLQSLFSQYCEFRHVHTRTAHREFLSAPQHISTSYRLLAIDLSIVN